jgi:hypothetical protein
MKLLYKSEKHDIQLYRDNRICNYYHGDEFIYSASLDDEKAMTALKEIINTMIIYRNDQGIDYTKKYVKSVEVINNELSKM